MLDRSWSRLEPPGEALRYKQLPEVASSSYSTCTNVGFTVRFKRTMTTLPRGRSRVTMARAFCTTTRFFFPFGRRTPGRVFAQCVGN